MATLACGNDGTYLILVTGTVCHVIAALLEDSVGSDVSHYSVDGLLCLGEVRLVSGHAV